MEGTGKSLRRELTRLTTRRRGPGSPTPKRPNSCKGREQSDSSHTARALALARNL